VPTFDEARRNSPPAAAGRPGHAGLPGAFFGRYGLDQAAARKVSCAFGAGMASSGEMCGAATGALMVIGLAHGRTTPEDVAAKERTSALSRRLWEEFRARRGSLVCRELLGIDLMGSPPSASSAPVAPLTSPW
jgi:C_GCAxxG_C_C family probable redox protein